MSKKFQPKDQELKQLIDEFEANLAEDVNLFYPEDELEKIIDFYESTGNIDKALFVINKATTQFPYSTTFLFKQVQLFIKNKLSDEAWAVIDKIKIYEPNSSELLLLEADLLMLDGQFEDAIGRLALLYDTVGHEEKADVLLEMADVYEVAGKLKRLQTVLEEILMVYPTNEEAIHRYYSLLEQLEKFEQGVATFKAILELSPYNLSAWMFLANCYKQLGFYEKALDALEFLIAIEESYYAYSNYAICLQDLELYDRAIETYQYMLATFSEQYSMYIDLGRCYSKMFEYENARKAFYTALEISESTSDRANCHYAIAREFAAESLWVYALSHFKKSVEFKRNKAKFWNGMAEAQFEIGEIEDSAQSYIQSLAINERQSKIWRLLANCYYQLSYNDLIIMTLKNAISVLPNNARLHFEYAAYLLHLGQRQEGLKQLTIGLELNPKKNRFIFALFSELENDADVAALIEQYKH